MHGVCCKAAGETDGVTAWCAHTDGRSDDKFAGCVVVTAGRPLRPQQIVSLAIVGVGEQSNQIRPATD